MIMNNIPKLPGIYKLTCVTNGKIYIGESLNLSQRMRQHRHSQHTKRCQQVIISAIKKYGWNNFTVEILVTFSSENITKKELVTIEGRYIAKYDATNRKIGYNTLKEGTSRKDYRTSPETKEKLSLALKGKMVGENNPMFGKTGDKNSRFGVKMSQETKDKISKSNKGKLLKEANYYYQKTGESHPCFGKKKSREAIEKSSNCHRKPIYQIDIKSNKIIRMWKCAADAGKSLNRGKSPRKNINRAIMKKQSSAYGYKWAFVKETVNKKIVLLDN